MEVLVKKYVSGTFVETYEQTFEVPDSVDPDDYDAVMSYLEEQNMLDDDDWGDRVSFDDNIQDIEYEIEEVTVSDSD